MRTVNRRNKREIHKKYINVKRSDGTYEKCLNTAYAPANSDTTAAQAGSVALPQRKPRTEQTETTGATVGSSRYMNRTQRTNANNPFDLKKRTLNPISLTPAGVTFTKGYPENIHSLRERQVVCFVPEPDNKYDPDAVKIVALNMNHPGEALELGYIPKMQTSPGIDYNNFYGVITKVFPENNGKNAGYRFRLEYNDRKTHMTETLPPEDAKWDQSLYDRLPPEQQDMIQRLLEAEVEEMDREKGQSGN